MAFHENIERIFLEEIREKKKTGSGSFHKRGKGVKHGISGALRTPFFYMTNKEKKKLNGEITVIKLNEIIPYEELKTKDIEIQKTLLTKWRELYENDLIIEGMDIYKKDYFDLVTSLQLPKKPRGGNNKRANRKKKGAVISTTLEFESPVVSAPVVEAPQPQEPTQVQKVITEGLYLEYNGEYNADELSKLFTKLQLLIDGETNKYNIMLSLSEKKK